MSRPIVLNTVAEVDAWAEKETTPIAAVLTMGALHQGHAELVRYAKANTPSGTRVIASIFVNPTQFNNSSDLAEYPRTLDSDLDTLQSAGADAVFVPDVAQMYPNGLEVNPPMEPGAIGDVLEGKARPGHFRGMLTVVERLLSITHANYSFFGEKDFQQLQIIKKLVEKENFPIKNDFSQSGFDEELEELLYFGINTKDKFQELIRKHRKKVLEIDSEDLDEFHIKSYSAELGEDYVNDRIENKYWFAYQGLLRIALELEFGDVYRQYSENRDGLM